MKPLFTGTGTALITPFKNGEIDWDALDNLVESQIAGGVSALIAAGTTGEPSTMTWDEHIEVIRFVAERAKDRACVIAGTGSNCTREVIHAANVVKDFGVAAQLVVTPYYNKTSQAGLVAHFTAMAEAGGIPVIVYNVPSRTGLNIAPETALELSKHPLINGIKEASGNISQVAKIAALCGDELNIYSGNDDQVVPLLALGGKGVISVLSNVAPQYTHDICAKWFAGETAESLSMQLKAVPLIKALFADVNPIPVKTAMARMGLCSDVLRLPLCEMSEENRARLFAAMDACGVSA